MLIFQLLHLAILQTVPRLARKIQRRRCQFLQDRDDSNDEAGVGYGRVSSQGSRDTVKVGINLKIGCKHVM